VDEFRADDLLVDGRMRSAGLTDVSLSRVEQALLDMRNRRSTWQFVSIITLTSVVMSVAITMLIAVTTNMNSEYMVYAFASSIIVPMLVAPVVSYEAARIMGALDRAVSELEQVAHVDALTGESNRRHFFSRGREIISSRADGVVLVGMVDIDDFKTVNDTFGHAAGDEVLRRLARQLRDACGPDALIGRLGGDEFAVVLAGGPDIEDRAALLAAACGLVLVSDTLAASASVGLIDASGLDLDEALRRADTALYASKSTSIRETDRSPTEDRVTEGRVTEGRVAEAS
jgi:diguanylate cyclase (GGDEF)-like protein